MKNQKIELYFILYFYGWHQNFNKYQLVFIVNRSLTMCIRTWLKYFRTLSRKCARCPKMKHVLSCRSLYPSLHDLCWSLFQIDEYFLSCCLFVRPRISELSFTVQQISNNVFHCTSTSLQLCFSLPRLLVPYRVVF